ncbi:MAG: class F sortase, partial [Naasia sp.]
GIKADGTMGVPSDWDAVGWFTGGGKPGGRGPTVIAGHVDSVSAPAVFFRLDELVPGDSVEVVDVDGAVVTYTVSEVADYPKAEFPTSRVFGAIPGDELRLITCGGYFDPAAASYEDNRVVFAVRA